MNKLEFIELRNQLQQFEEDHSLELLCANETKALNSMISICTDYIVNMEEEEESSEELSEKALNDLGFDDLESYNESMKEEAI